MSTPKPQLHKNSSLLLYLPVCIDAPICVPSPSRVGRPESRPWEQYSGKREGWTTQLWSHLLPCNSLETFLSHSPGKNLKTQSEAGEKPIEKHRCIYKILIYPKDMTHANNGMQKEIKRLTHVHAYAQGSVGECKVCLVFWTIVLEISSLYCYVWKDVKPCPMKQHLDFCEQKHIWKCQGCPAWHMLTEMVNKRR